MCAFECAFVFMFVYLCLGVCVCVGVYVRLCVCMCLHASVYRCLSARSHILWVHLLQPNLLIFICLFSLIQGDRGPTVSNSLYFRWKIACAIGLNNQLLSFLL